MPGASRPKQAAALEKAQGLQQKYLGVVSSATKSGIDLGFLAAFKTSRSEPIEISFFLQIRYLLVYFRDQRKCRFPGAIK